MKVWDAATGGAAEADLKVRVMSLSARVRHFPSRRRPDVKCVAVLRFDQRAIPVDVKFAAATVSCDDVVPDPAFCARCGHECEVAFALKTSSLARGDDRRRSPVRGVIAVGNLIMSESQRGVRFVADENMHSDAAHTGASYVLWQRT
jgi:hypothetical protein